MSSLEVAVTALAEGGVVGVPTETVYGLAVDPHDRKALARLAALKGRDPRKPIALLGASLSDLEAFGEITAPARQLAVTHWPGPLTLVVAARGSDVVGDPERGTIGLRVPDHPITLDLLARTGPLAVTSANLSGHPEALDDAAARVLFGDEVAVFLPGAAVEGTGSTVVDTTVDPPRVLRRGPVRIDG